MLIVYVKIVIMCILFYVYNFFRLNFNKIMVVIFLNVCGCYIDSCLWLLYLKLFVIVIFLVIWGYCVYS